MTDYTVKKILKEWIPRHGYDGLVSKDDQCCCLIYDEFLVCDNGEDRSKKLKFTECSPGVKVSCDCGGHKYHVMKS